MSAKPPVTIKTNEAPSHNLKDGYEASVVSHTLGGGTSAKENSFKTFTQTGQLAFTAQSGNLSSVLTLSGTVVPSPLCSVLSNPYSFPRHKLFGRLPGSFNRFSMVKTTGGFEKSRNLRAHVEKAIKDHKVFTCVGVYPAVKKALQNRGWVEKSQNLGFTPRYNNFGSSIKDFDSRGFDDESDQAWMNRVLRDYPPDFMWVIRRDNIDWRGMHKDQIINRFPKAFFTTKVGIAACLQNMQWFSESGVSDTFFPRCYRLCIDEEKTSFVDDYRLSACMGLLKWVVTSYEKEGEDGVMDPGSRVVSLAVDFAIRQVNNYVRMRRHEDIDWLIPPSFMGQHWDVFLNQYYNVVQLQSKLAPNDSQDSGKLKYEAAKKALQRIVPFWPQYHIDGVNNVWICKPGARSRGKGIIILNQLDKILDLLNQNNSRESNWVVQKYIERPLLIYKTKFDIRQWFVVSDWSPLTVWFYKESYIRFCTKPFSLDDFHESIHLCNNAIQCRYQNSDLRDTALPDENMWDCYTFQAYLKTLGKMDLWDSLIYPGMKQGILGVLLSSQETADVRKNCFELYGADFMLSEDMRPWLIEINSCPCMSPSTSVTARMCAQCLEDCVKVIVDRREDRNAETGFFELAYKQNVTPMPPPFNGVDLVVQGKKLSRDVDWPSIMSKYNKRASTGGSSRLMRATQHANSVSNGLTFMDLVHRLRVKDASTSESTNNDNTESTSPVQLKRQTSASRKSARKMSLQNRKNSQATSNGLKPESDSGSQLVQQPPNRNSKQLPNHQNSNAKASEEAPKKLKSVPSVEKTKSIQTSGHKSKICNQLRVQGSITSDNFHALRQSNPETLLSTLLKSSLINPTMVDLIRLSQEGNCQPALTKKNCSENKPETESETAKATTTTTRGRSQSLTINSSKWKSEPLGIVNNNGKIRPNARINSYLSNVSPKNSDQTKLGASGQSTNSNEKETEYRTENRNYSKLPSSFYDIHKLNTSQITLDKIVNNAYDKCEPEMQQGRTERNRYFNDGRSATHRTLPDACFIDSDVNDHEIFICHGNENPVNSSPTSDPEPHYELKSQGGSDFHENFPGFVVNDSQPSPKPPVVKQEGSLHSLHHLHHQHHPHPCYRIALEHPSNNAALLSSKKYLTSLPLKTINLHMT